MRALVLRSRRQHTQESRRNTDDHQRDGYLARVCRVCHFFAVTLRIDSSFAMGEELRSVTRALVLIITHIVPHIFSKCYMGLRTPRRTGTVMEPKKRQSGNAKPTLHTSLTVLCPQSQQFSYMSMLFESQTSGDDSICNCSDHQVR